MAKPTGILTTLWIIARLLLKRFSSGAAAGLSEVGREQGLITDQLPLDLLPPGNPSYTQTLQVGQSEWSATGLFLQPEDELTLFADGYIVLSRLLDLKIGPAVGLWYRVGTGRVCKLPCSGATITADSEGELQLALKPPGEWARPDGTFDPRYSRSDGSGGFSVGVVHWQACSAKQGLEEWCARAEPAGLLQKARDLLSHAPTTPGGWHYLWRLGNGYIYSEPKDNGPSIHCHTHEDVGILQYPVQVPLTDQLCLDWQWKVECLPSLIREDIQPTHDYLSIAVEFDNGLDLTYLWSSELEEGKIFQCPLPWWSDRETHWVVRSGQGQLGLWLTEHRCLLDDYRVAIGGDEPAHVVGVWLIAVSVFQRNRGICEYRNIQLADGSGSAVDIGPGSGKAG